MESIKKIGLIVILGCFALSCQTDTTTDYAAIEKEVAARLQAFYDGLTSGSAEALPDFYSSDERFYWVEDGQVTYPNHAALVSSLEGLYGMVASVEARVLERKVEVLDATTAIIYSEYEQDFALKSGFNFSINGAMTATMKKEGDTWRFLVGHSSTKKQRGG